MKLSLEPNTICIKVEFKEYECPPYKPRKQRVPRNPHAPETGFLWNIDGNYLIDDQGNKLIYVP